MKKIIRKLYWNPMKEENWLNNLAVKGLSLTDYSWGRYVFEDTEPGEYTYRIDLLEKNAQSAESEVYLRFLENSGVEVAATYRRWVFLRKKTADGPFSLYSDNESKMLHLKRIANLWGGLDIMVTGIGLLNLILGVSGIFKDERNQDGIFLGSVYIINLIGGGLCLGIGILFFFTLYRPIRIQIRKLRKIREIFE